MSGFALGIDLGTTSVKAVVMDIESESVVFSDSSNTDANIPSDIGDVGYEQNVLKIYSAMEKCLNEISPDIKARTTIISFTGQMHGLVLWNKKPHAVDLDVYFKNKNASNLYTWQDQRSTPEFIESLPVPDSHITLATGFGCVTYFWLLRNRPDILYYDWMGTLMDYFVCSLCGLDHPVTTDQLAASLGYFNTETHEWNTDILSANEFPVQKLPKVVRPGHVSGYLADDWLGLKTGVTLLAGLGDVQCSFMSAVTKYQHAAVLNIGTSLQLGCIVKDKDMVPSDSKSIQYFPYFHGDYLALAASLNGGNVIQQFVIMMTEWMKTFGIPVDDVWNKLLTDTQDLPLDDNLEVRPTLFGERHAPGTFGRICGLTPDNMHISTIFNSLCFGVVKNAQDMMTPQFLELNNIKRLVCSGNVLLRNPVVKMHVLRLFDKFEIIDGTACDSATGATMCAIQYHNSQRCNTPHSKHASQ